MNAIFTLLGVDYRQWKAVTRTLVRTDFRPPVHDLPRSYSLRSAGGWLTIAAVYGLFGASVALLVIANDDVLLTGTIALTYVAVLLTTTVLSQHGATMLAADDVNILGPRPVSSRTFLAIRVTNVLFHALLVTTLMIWPPVVAYTFAHGASAARGAAAAAAFYAGAIAITLLLTAGYGSLLRHAGASRLRRVIGYAQMATGLLLYGGFFLVLQTFGMDALARASMPRGPWLLLVPPAWFASYLEIATGVAGAGAWIRAALSLASLILLVRFMRETLGLDYAERLAQLAATTAPTDSAPSNGWASRLFARDESRAVALLVIAHFRHDIRVRMGVLAIVPMVAIYALLYLRGGASGDPFASGSSSSVAFLGLAALIFPAVLTRVFVSSDAWRASWIYDVTPTDRGRLIIALERVAVVYFMVPFLLLLAALFAWRFGNARDALIHATLLGIVSHLALQTALLVSPRLPFSRPPDKAMSGAGMFAWMFVVIVGGQLLLVFLQRWVYPEPPRIAAVGAALLIASWGLQRALGGRARRTKD